MGGQEAINTYFTEMYVAEDHLLGWQELNQGRHTLTFVCAGKDGRSAGYDLGIDTLIPARVATPAETGGAAAASLRSSSGQNATVAEMKAGLAANDEYVREAAAWAFTQRTQAVSEGVDQLIIALHDPDPVVRGLSALALSECPDCAAKALTGLITGLKDADENVRLASADAIAVVGPTAAPGSTCLD